MFEDSKLSKRKIKQIIEHFCIDIDATRSSMLLNLNRKTVNRYFMAFRRLIYAWQKSMNERTPEIIGLRESAPPVVGPEKSAPPVVELDESAFGSKSYYKNMGPSRRFVFGIYQRDGLVYTELATDCSAKTLESIIKNKISPSSIVNTDSWNGYDGLADAGYEKHFRIPKKRCHNDIHINGIEAFWSFSKRRLTKFNGTKKYFELHIKECEWRYNKSIPQLINSLKEMIECISKSNLTGNRCDSSYFV